MLSRMSFLSVVLIAPALAMSPVSHDRVMFDGTIRTDDGSASISLYIEPGYRPVGLYLAIAGIEEFTVALNDIPVREIVPGRAPRTILRTLDLSDFAHLLRRGNNRLCIIPAQDAEQFRLRAWTSNQAWFLSSLHAHTTYSDGSLTVHELLKEALADGGRAYAITDHETLGQCYDTAFHPVGNLQPIRGYEWTTDSGHANLLGIEGANTMPRGSIPQMIDEASWRGALVQINHPCNLGNLAWARRPYLDPGVDMIEVFNSVTWFPSRGTDSDAQAVAWWHDLLAAGATIAGVGNSDFHRFAPGIDVYRSCSFIRATSNEPDSILKYAKLGTVMVMDKPDDTRLWLYADTNNNGTWDIVMGQHCRIRAGARTIRFRLEVEDADWGDVVRVYDRTGEIYSKTLWTGGDFSYEWSRSFSSTDRNFMRVEVLGELGADYEGVTNPIYINHPLYELGPLRLVTKDIGWPDTLYVGRRDTIRFSLHNAAGYSPYRYALLAAFDTALFTVTSWQTVGPGVGAVSRRTSSGHTVIEWRGGYEWLNRLSPGAQFDFRLTVRPKTAGLHPVLFSAWADDRLFVIDQDPDTGFSGPENRTWHLRRIPVAQATDVADAPEQIGVTTLRSATLGRGRLVVELLVSRPDPARSLTLRDAAGRTRQKMGLSHLLPGVHRLLLAPHPPGIYFLCLETYLGPRTQKTALLR